MSVDPTELSQPDVDNMLKPLIDALNKTVINDDRQVPRIVAEKAYINSPPKAVIGEIQDNEEFALRSEVTVIRVVRFIKEHES